MSRIYYPFGHFPTPAEHAAPSDGYFLPAFPVALSLAEALLWYWRVKRWRLTLTIESLSGSEAGYPKQGSFTASDISLVGDFVPAIFSDDGLSTFALTDETQLMLPGSFLVPASAPAIAGTGTATGPTDASDPTPVTASMDFSGSNLSFQVNLPSLYTNGLFYPDVALQAHVVSNAPGTYGSF